MPKKGKELKTCNYEMHDGKPCGRSLHDGEHCIFHSKDVEGKKEEFTDEFWEEFDEQKESKYAYDFSGFVFPSLFSFEKADLQGAYLRGADLKSTNLTNSSFENANVIGVKYNRFARYRGIQLSKCFGSPIFVRYAKDQEYLEDFRSSKLRFPLYLIWLILADCGRSLLLWSSWAIFMAFSFAAKFFSMGPEAFSITNLKFSFETMFYYSVVTFTTLGFGDVTPKTVEASRWVMFEVVVGYVMLGGLISIFANKLARRS